jgi:hypothetical protein
LVLEDLARNKVFCYPSDEYLKRRLGCSLRTAQNVLKELENDSVLLRIRSEGGGMRLGIVMLERMDPDRPAASNETLLKLAIASLKDQREGAREHNRVTSKVARVARNKLRVSGMQQVAPEERQPWLLNQDEGNDEKTLNVPETGTSNDFFAPTQEPGNPPEPVAIPLAAEPCELLATFTVSCYDIPAQVELFPAVAASAEPSPANSENAERGTLNAIFPHQGEPEKSGNDPSAPAATPPSRAIDAKVADAIRGLREKLGAGATELPEPAAIAPAEERPRPPAANSQQQDAAEFLWDLDRRRFQVGLKDGGDQIWVHPPASLTEADMKCIANLKAEIVRLLRAKPASQPAPQVGDAPLSQGLPRSLTASVSQGLPLPHAAKRTRDARTKSELSGSIGRLRSNPGDEFCDALADRMVEVFRDKNPALSKETYLGLFGEIERGDLPESILHDAVERAFRPQSRIPGAVFIGAVKGGIAAYHAARRKAGADGGPR